jgi:hypothetical protein
MKLQNLHELESTTEFVMQIGLWLLLTGFKIWFIWVTLTHIYS